MYTHNPVLNTTYLGGYEKMKRETVTLLWSGGWDGTFRFLQLCQNDIDIQPIYIIDENRKSSQIEMDRINQIIKICRAKFKANILDVIFYDKLWILENCKNERISESFKILREKYNVGIQYEWFALLSDYLDTKMESAVVHQYHGKVEDAIDNEGKLIEIENDFLPESRYCVIANGENENITDIFGNIILPVIKLTKQDEERIARENGWMDIMNLSWFCHTPIHGKPCGLCGPCDDAMNTGMEWRMPMSSQFRYKRRKFLASIKRKIIK